MGPLHLFKLRWILQPPSSRFALSCLIVFLSLSESIKLKAQTNAVIDSLEAVLENSIADTNRVITLDDLGWEMRRAGMMEKAMQLHKESYSLAEKLGYLKGMSQATRNIGYVYFFLSNYPTAMQYADSAVILSIRSGNKHHLANCYNLIGMIHYYTGNLTESLKNYNLSLEIYKEIKYSAGIGIAYNNIVGIYSAQGDKIRAIETCKDALEIGKELGDKYQMTWGYNKLGYLYYSMGNYTEALQNQIIALKIWEERGSNDLETGPYIFNQLGKIYFQLEEYDKALKYHTSALNIDIEKGYKIGITDDYSFIADVYIRKGQFNVSREFYFKSLKLSQEIGHQVGIGIAFLGIGRTYKEEGEYANALDFYLKAENIFKYSKLQSNIAYTYIHIVELFNDYSIAIEKEYIPISFADAYNYLKESELFYQKSGDKPGMADCYRLWAETDSIRGNYRQAFEHYKLYTLYYDSVITDKNSNQLASLKIQFETENKDKEIQLLNHENDIQALLISKQKLQRNGAIISMAFLLAIGFLLFRSLHLRKKLEKQSAIIQERKRISADLHDDIGTGLSKISLLSELVRSQAKTPAAKKEAEKIADTSKELLQSIGEIIWALNANNDHLENLVAYIRRYAAEYFENSGVDL